MTSNLWAFGWLGSLSRAGRVDDHGSRVTTDGWILIDARVGECVDVLDGGFQGWLVARD